ncbi:MmcQ/YjbR family DNA-binding protein [Spongisporangium articulatum]|uniref:MmcQ/YjbR family DNA-binding protein n=1 Tax=Spongisporangium articulatum TaxID=3362603 RepID=A0ABW8AH87_9ACTN
MATYEDVRRLAMALPGVTEGARWRNPTWFVGTRGFAWQRPLSKKDRKDLGDDAPHPDREVLGLVVEDLGVREGLLAEGRPGLFTIPHFADYAAFLVLLDEVDEEQLAELLEDAWAVVAPPA